MEIIILYLKKKNMSVKEWSEGELCVLYQFEVWKKCCLVQSGMFLPNRMISRWREGGNRREREGEGGGEVTNTTFERKGEKQTSINLKLS